MPSSEYVAGQNGTPVKRTLSSPYTDDQSKTNGAAVAAKLAPTEIEKKDAGIVQLVIAVAGIYGSLYARPTVLLPPS